MLKRDRENKETKRETKIDSVRERKREREKERERDWYPGGAFEHKLRWR